MIPNYTIYFYQKISDYAKAASTVAKGLVGICIIDAVARVVFEAGDISSAVTGSLIKFTACLVWCGFTNKIRSFANGKQHRLQVMNLNLPPINMTQLLLQS